jgi:hypothetical protein
MRATKIAIIEDVEELLRAEFVWKLGREHVRDVLEDAFHSGEMSPCTFYGYERRLDATRWRNSTPTR